MSTKFTSLLIAATLFISTSVTASPIGVNFFGHVTTVGSSISGGSVDVGDLVIVRLWFDYSDPDSNPDINYGSYEASTFSVFFSSGFSASSTGANITVQNDQQNGWATLPADGMAVLATSTSGGGINGRLLESYHFGLRRENVESQLWFDDALPDFSDLSNITLSDINTPDWRWMQFAQLDDESIFDSQIRWDITSFTIATPEPSTLVLLGLGFIALGMYRRRV